MPHAGDKFQWKGVRQCKLLERRSQEEGQFLDDIIEFIVNAGARGNEELFSFRREGGLRKALRGCSVHLN